MENAKKFNIFEALLQPNPKHYKISVMKWKNRNYPIFKKKKKVLIKKVFLFLLSF